MTYLSNVKPSTESFLNNLETINECFLILVLYTLYFSTNYNNVTGYKEFVYNVGWVIIGLISIVLVGNGVIILRQIYITLKLKAKKVCCKNGLKKKIVKKEKE